MYIPSDDSFFFAEFLKNYFSKIKFKKKQNKLKKIKFLDIGTGSGILAEQAIKSGINLENITALDIDKKSISYVKKTIKGIKVIHSNLFSNINKKVKFDIITFNAPYLPRDKENKEPKDSQLETTGGKRGDEISLKFLKQAKFHLNKGGKIFLLIS